MRLRVGLLLAVLGAYLMFDPVARSTALIGWVRVWWPYLLIVLAVVNLLMRFFDSASLLVPAVLLLAGVAGLLQPNWQQLSTISAALPAVAVAAGIALALGGRRRVSTESHRVVAALWSRRVYAPHEPLPARTYVVCAVGEIRYDLRSAYEVGDKEVQLRIVAGHVKLVIPHGWRLELASVPSRSLSIREVGVPPPEGPCLKLRLSGGLGALIVVRG